MFILRAIRSRENKREKKFIFPNANETRSKLGSGYSQSLDRFFQTAESGDSRNHFNEGTVAPQKEKFSNTAFI